MLDVWNEHGPPVFITQAAAHLDPKKRKKGRKASQGTASGEDKKTGTMADLAAMFGLGKGKKKATF